MESDLNKREIVYSSVHKAEIEDYSIPDIDRNAEFSDFFARSRQFTMTGKEVMFATYQAARYVAQRNIPGEIVECGVWRGGSALLAALAVRAVESEKPTKTRKFFGKSKTARRIWLYDTFEGMTAPTECDVDLTGTSATDYMGKFSDDGRWCYADEADVRGVFAAEGFGPEQIEVVKGDICETLKSHKPGQIALLRLDTDWYESTKAELEVLYPLLSPGGVLIIDDYGHWDGAREAVDEFFAHEPPLLLNRIGYAVRVAIKI